MKKLIVLCSALIVVGVSFSQNNATSEITQKEPIAKAAISDEEKNEKQLVYDELTEFLVKSTDACMVDISEGKLAAAKGTSGAVRDYGNLMLEEQPELLLKIQLLAGNNNIVLPAGISDKKENGTEILLATDKSNFDEAYIKMMIVNHEKLLKLLKRAIMFNDKEVSTFALAALPIIESDYDKIKAAKLVSVSAK